MLSIDFSTVSSKRKISSWKLCFAPYGIAIKMNFWLLSVFLLVLCCSLVLGEYPGEFSDGKRAINSFSMFLHRKKKFFAIRKKYVN